MVGDLHSSTVNDSITRFSRTFRSCKGPGYLDRPALVAEVPLDLAEDGGGRIRGKLHTPVQIETVDGLDEADATDLDEVLHRLAARREPPCQTPHQEADSE